MPTRFSTKPCLILLLLAAISATLTAATGCSTRTSDRSLVFLDVSQAIDAVRGERRILRSPTAGIWLDPRTDQEFAAGHIPGAIHMPLERIRQEHRQLNEFDVIVVYGNDFNSPRAAAASKTLLELGHTDVRTLRGGLKAWEQAGNTVESSG